MKRTKVMTISAAAFGLLLLVTSVSVHGHDITQDSRYKAAGNTTHTCHHMRVDYWQTLSDIAEDKVYLLRYYHAGDDESGQLAELRAKQARTLDNAARAGDEYVAGLQKKANDIGCDPWP